MIRWRQIPWPLWLYSAVGLLGMTVVEIEARSPIPAKILYPLVMFTWLYFLLKGIRWVWIVTVAIQIVGVIPSLLSGTLRWQGAVLGLVGLVLLLLPVTRQYFDNNAAAVSTNG